MDHEVFPSKLGDLRWTGESANGMLSFHGRSVALAIEFDFHEPTRDEIIRAIDLASTLLPNLTGSWEQAARHAAAVEVTEAACSRSLENAERPEEVERLEADMQLQSLDFIYFDEHEQVAPYLAYRCPTIFPTMSLCIQFLTDVSIDEVTLNEVG